MHCNTSSRVALTPHPRVPDCPSRGRRGHPCTRLTSRATQADRPSDLSVREEGGNGCVILMLPIFISFPQISLSTAGKSFSESKILTAASSNLLLKKEKEKVKDRDREKSKDPKQVPVSRRCRQHSRGRAPADPAQRSQLWGR